MRKKVLLLAAVLAFSTVMTACSGDQAPSAVKSGFELGHFDGSDASAGYDTDLLYKNNSDFWGGDSGVIWVPEKEGDPDSGYFYQYMSGCSSVYNGGLVTESEDGDYRSYIAVSRSKDLNDWTVCGAVDNGYGVKVRTNEWVYDYTWAPEVIQAPEGEHYYSGKYFMYFSAGSLTNDGERVEGTPEQDGIPAEGVDKKYSNSTERWDRLNLCIAVSDSPMGPFELVSSYNVYGDENAKNLNGEVITGINPPVFFADHFGLNEEWAAIDLSPFFDENGDLYLYFVKHISTSSNEKEEDWWKGNQVWGIKMKDMITPDYDTVTKLIANRTYTTVNYKGESQLANDPQYPRYLDSSYDYSKNFKDGTLNEEERNDGGVCEAPQMITTKDKNGKTVYLLTYSPRGVGAWDYDVKFAYSYSPLGPFIKPKRSEGSTILGVDTQNDFMTNLGHVQFLDVDDELWCVHWESPQPNNSNVNPGRIYGLTNISWVENEFHDFPLPVANGPTRTLQPLPSVYTGYRNIAGDAKVSATNVMDNSVKYLTDNLVVTSEVWFEREFRAKGKTVITLTFDTPRAVRGIFVYNSYTYDNAFEKITSVNFTLAEKPSWYAGEATSCFIENLGIPESSIDFQNRSMRPGSAALATFNEIKVSKIEICIDDLLAENGKELCVSEIYVMGK